MTGSLSLGEGLRRLRAGAGLSQKQLAEVIEVDPSFISRLESGEREPSLGTLKEISAAVAAPPGVLLAIALLADMPEENRERYQPVIAQLVELTNLYQLRLTL